MDTKVPDGPNARFHAADVVASAFPDAASADLAANAADLTLIIDKAGVIRDAAFPGEDFEPSDYEDWVGKKWADLVAADSRAKVAALLSSPGQAGERRWRHVNHSRDGELDLPIRFFTMAASKPGWTLAIGRDMRGVSRMQQRLLDAQQSMEREYTRVREAETRFRMLFQISTEGVLVISGVTLKITDVNPAAARFLGRRASDVQGSSLEMIFGDRASDIRETLAVARKTGRAENVELTLNDDEQTFTLLASVFREGQDASFLCRLTPGAAASAPSPDTSLNRLAEILPDGLALTGEDGKILSVNEGFIDMAQLYGSDEAVGVSIDQFLGRTEVEFNVLLANLREHGVIRHFATTLRSRLDIEEPVEVSAVSAPGPVGRVFGFAIRPVGRRVVASRGNEGTLPSSADQLSDLVGRVALKDIVRESTDMIERSCIEAALDLTNDNRASAAEILGLSRQSLYAKMHRHKLGDLQSKSDS